MTKYAVEIKPAAIPKIATILSAKQGEKKVFA